MKTCVGYLRHSAILGIHVDHVVTLTAIAPWNSAMHAYIVLCFFLIHLACTVEFGKIHGCFAHAYHFAFEEWVSRITPAGAWAGLVLYWSVLQVDKLGKVVFFVVVVFSAILTLVSIELRDKIVLRSCCQGQQYKGNDRNFFHCWNRHFVMR